MADPQTTNVGLFVPNTGADVGTWGAVALNPDFVALDGLIAGVQAISVSNVPITLTAPAGFVATPSAGPTQAQNRVLRFTGTLTGNVVVTLPLPGAYIIDHRALGNFVIQFRGVVGTEVFAVPPGAITTIYNDGANVRPTDMGKPGDMEFWAGLTAMPGWVGNCTVAPYLYCDGAVYNIATYPFLAARLGGAFGGNNITTFGVPDERGRIPLAYDGTGTRITVAGCGLNGQTLGNSLDQQTVTLGPTQMAPYTPAGAVSTSTTAAEVNALGIQNPPINPQNVVQVGGTGSGGSITRPPAFASVSSFTGTPSPGVSAPVPNVQPTQVTGIWVVKT